MLKTARDGLEGDSDLLGFLADALVAEPPAHTRDGGYVAPGYDAELDDARQLRDEGRSIIAGLQKDYAEQTGISALKIKHNNVLGYFVETPATHAKKMMAEPLSATFIHRQTTANAVRFTTVELSNLETRIMNAGNLAVEIEARIFARMRDAVIAASDPIAKVAHSISEIDVASALAALAIDRNWVCPVIDDSRAFSIEDGRHPVVELALKRDTGAQFVPNNCDLTADSDHANGSGCLPDPIWRGNRPFCGKTH